MQKASKAGIPRIFCHYKGVKLWMFAFCSGHSLNWWKTKYHHESAICPLLGVIHCRYFGLSLHVCLELTLRYVENLVSMCVFLCVRERERERERGRWKVLFINTLSYLKMSCCGNVILNKLKENYCNSL